MTEKVGEGEGIAPHQNDVGDWVCQHGTSIAVHCCNCHSGFVFDMEHECPDSMADAAEMLWVVLANVSGGDWTKQTPEWQEAAARWRDNYFAALKREQLGGGDARVAALPATQGEIMQTDTERRRALDVDIADVITCFKKWDASPDLALDQDTISALHDLVDSWKRYRAEGSVLDAPPPAGYVDGQPAWPDGTEKDHIPESFDAPPPAEER